MVEKGTSMAKATASTNTSFDAAANMETAPQKEYRKTQFREYFLQGYRGVRRHGKPGGGRRGESQDLVALASRITGPRYFARRESWCL
jgi:hypothetical protein